jgi:alpha-mannosidase
VDYIIYNPLPVENHCILEWKAQKIRLGPLPPFFLGTLASKSLEEYAHQITNTEINQPIEVVTTTNSILVKNSQILLIFGKKDGGLKAYYYQPSDTSEWHDLLYGKRNGYPSISYSANKYQSLKEFLNISEEKILLRKGARIKIYQEDFKENPYPAWNICRSYTQHPLQVKLTHLSIETQSPSSITILSKLSADKSSLDIRYQVFTSDPMLHITTSIDLQTPKILIKHFFPCNLASNDMVCSSQFGNVIRKRTPTTKMEAAKWEFSQQRWLDVADADVGMALLNQDRYGCSGNRVGFGLTLVRSPPYPGDNFYTHEEVIPQKEKPTYTDLMKHQFSYGIYPHENNWKQANIPMKARTFATPCIILIPENVSQKLSEKIEENLSIIQVKKEVPQTLPLTINQIFLPKIEIFPHNVILTTIKAGEWQEINSNSSESIIYQLDPKSPFYLNHSMENWQWENNHIIIRLFEAHGKETEARIGFANFSQKIHLKSYQEVDLLERGLETPQILSNSQFKITIKPYEIKSLRIYFELA